MARIVAERGRSRRGRVVAGGDQGMAGSTAAQSPLEVMLLAMAAHVAAGDLDKAASLAKDAAPYVHPRLSTVEPKAKEERGPGEGVSNRELAMAILAMLRDAATEEAAEVPETGATGPRG